MNTWIKHNLKDRQTDRQETWAVTAKWSLIPPPSWPAASSSINLFMELEHWNTEILHLKPKLTKFWNISPVHARKVAGVLQESWQAQRTSAGFSTGAGGPNTPHHTVQLWSYNHKGAWQKCDFPANFHSKFCFINSFKLIITMSMLNCFWELTLCCKNLL